MYGKRRFSKGRSTRRASTFTRAGPRRTYKKVGNSFAALPRFATVGFARNVEKKYFDKTYQSSNSESLTGNTGVNDTSRGVTYVSNTWGNYSFGSQTAPVVVSNDMLKGLDTGTTARTRIGNKIKVNHIKGALTFNAAAVLTGTGNIDSQNGESVAYTASANPWNYLRTTYRFVIVKDLQVNSTDVQVTWQQVFDTTSLQAGVHSELNVDNMGRFIVLEDKIFTVDSQSPQKTCQFLLGGSRVGNVRYNGPTGTALTDKGIYIVWAAFVMGYASADASKVSIPSPVGHSRLCFTDD